MEKPEKLIDIININNNTNQECIKIVNEYIVDLKDSKNYLLYFGVTNSDKLSIQIKEVDVVYNHKYYRKDYSLEELNQSSPFFRLFESVDDLANTLSNNYNENENSVELENGVVTLTIRVTCSLVKNVLKFHIPKFDSSENNYDIALFLYYNFDLCKILNNIPLLKDHQKTETKMKKIIIDIQKKKRINIFENDKTKEEIIYQTKHVIEADNDILAQIKHELENIDVKEFHRVSDVNYANQFGSFSFKGSIYIVFVEINENFLIIQNLFKNIKHDIAEKNLVDCDFYFLKTVLDKINDRYLVILSTTKFNTKNNIDIYDMNTYSKVAKIKNPHNINSRVFATVFCCKKNYIISCGNLDSVKKWDFEGNELIKINLNNEIFYLDINNHDYNGIDKEYILIGEKGQVSAYKTENLENYKIFKDNNNLTGNHRYALIKDNKLFDSDDIDFKSGNFRAWNFLSGDLIQIIKMDCGICSLCYLKDDLVLGAGMDSSLCIFNLNLNNSIKEKRERFPNKICFIGLNKNEENKDSCMYINSQGEISYWDL